MIFILFCCYCSARFKNIFDIYFFSLFYLFIFSICIMLFINFLRDIYLRKLVLCIIN